MTDKQALTIDRRDDGVAIIWFDVPGQSVNMLRAGFERDFEDALTELDRDEDVQGVVLASGKEGFIAGADVNMLREIESAGEAARLSRTAQMVMDWLEAFRLPIVAAIKGACYGGGLEVALACASRIVADDDDTRLGQLEVNLGLIPGAGGTQRLPRRVGVEQALNLILTGKKLTPSQAVDTGLAEEAVHPAILLDVAAKRARELAQKGKAAGRRRDRDLKSLLLEDNPVGRRLLFRQAREKTLSRTQGNMPAPLRAIDVVRKGVEEDMQAGLAAESEAFGELVVSPEARELMHLFFAREALKKESGVEEDVQPREVEKVGVLGAGLMGSGIAYVTAARAGRPVRLKDVEHAALRDGLRNVRENLTERVEKGRMTEWEREATMARVHPTVDYSGFRRADVVIEAVFEDLELKHNVLRDVEEHTTEPFIFASNTSSLPIHEIAAAGSNPEHVIGMHYFSPVPDVPLLEVVVGEETAPWVTATCVQLGKEQGKTVIVVEDGTGFYTSRILAPTINEAAHLLASGIPIEAIDKALKQYGFPVGPLKLVDEVGIDVAAKISQILHEAFGSRMRPPQALQRIVEDDRQGRKNGRGFYRYEQKNGEYRRKKNGSGVDETIYDLLEIEPQEPPSEEEIARRCVLPMINEAVYCYAEGIVRSARDGDVGAVFGLGFPPFLGGPFRYVQNQGAATVKEQLEAYREWFGERYAPAPLLRQLAESGLGFYDDGAPAPGENGKE